MCRIIFHVQRAGGHLHVLHHTCISLLLSHKPLTLDDDVTVSKRHANLSDMWPCCHGNNQGRKPLSDALCKSFVIQNTRRSRNTNQKQALIYSRGFKETHQWDIIVNICIWPFYMKVSEGHFLQYDVIKFGWHQKFGKFCFTTF